MTNEELRNAWALGRRAVLGGAAALGSGVGAVGCADRFEAGAAGRSMDGAIARENRFAGTSEWLLRNVEPPVRLEEDEKYHRRRAIEGYCTKARVRPGETLPICVSTADGEPFRLDVFRMGYYGGAGARHMTTLGPIPSRTQPEATEGAKRLVDARWEPALELRILADWLSGVYLGKLTALAAGFESYVVFVVRDDRRADYLFQVSDLTWQAYNRWPGWRSLYDWGANKWHTAIGADVGFDRPYGLYYNTLPSGLNTLSNGSGEFLLWEHPLCFWLEREGYDVTYVSNLDTLEDPEGLLRARGFLSVGHDEYWTSDMVANVEWARDRGLSLAFFSGNSVYWRIYTNPSADGRPHRSLGRIERFADEHRLLGGTSYGVGLGDFVCSAPDHWLYAGTGMKQGDRIRQLVGWEYHGPPLRGGLEIVARGSVRNASGREPGEHVSTVYYGPAGNLVFDAGTCWWNMLLSSPPGFVSPPGKDFRHTDARLQRITANVLDRMLRGRT